MQGGLAGAVRPDDGHEDPGGCVHVHVPEHWLLMVGDGQVGYRNCDRHLFHDLSPGKVISRRVISNELSVTSYPFDKSLIDR